MQKIEYLFILSFLLLSLANYAQDNQYILKGRINQQFNGEQVVLFAFDDDVVLKVDTAKVVNGSFTFTGEENLKDIAILTIGNYPDRVVSQIVILDKGNIEVDMDKGKVYGTHLNELYQTYLDTDIIFGKELEAVAEKGEKANIIKIGTPRHKKLIEIGKYTVNFKKQNINNIVGQYFFEKEAGKSFAESFAFPPSESCLDSAFNIIYNAASDDYKQKKWIHKYIESLKSNAELLRQEKQQIERPYTDLVLNDLSGNKRKISDYIGNSRYILLDFWASWCAPCIAAFPELKEIYTKYNRTDLDIIGISLDISEGAWKNILERVDAPWSQLVVGSRELEAEVMEAYSFKGIPFAVLLNKNGNIIKSGHSTELVYEIIQLIE